jgi:pimeloyl-ACP methyl ester carboxylesterase
MRTTAMIEINGPKGRAKFQRQRKLASLMAASAWSVMALLAANLSEAADDSAFKTKDIILVHGAWADGSSWSKVIPLLERKGFHVTAVQLPLTSVADDVATLQRAIEFDPGPLLLVGHSYAGVVISEAGNDPKVSGLVYISAYAPDKGQSVVSLNALVPATPVTLEFSPNEGFLSLTDEGIRVDFAPDLPDTEQQTFSHTGSDCRSRIWHAGDRTRLAYKTVVAYGGQRGSSHLAAA